MAKRDKYNPDYQKLYPGVKLTPEVLKVLQQSDRKMKYMEVEIKHGVFRQDMEAKTATFTPTREDSLDRLICDEGIEFISEAPSPEEIAVHNDSLDRLRKALAKLEPDEYALIHALYFENLSERQLSAQTGIPQKTINYRRKMAIISLRRKFFGNF